MLSTFVGTPRRGRDLAQSFIHSPKKKFPLYILLRATWRMSNGER